MQKRKSRLVVVNSQQQVLLFQYVYPDGYTYWVVPGGSVEQHETFVQAAKRELYEETGWSTASMLVEPIWQQELVLPAHAAAQITTQEYFFAAVAPVDATITCDHWTTNEREVIAAYRWWSVADLLAAREKIFPDNLVALLQIAWQAISGGQTSHE